jgi:hypothetical protein
MSEINNSYYASSFDEFRAKGIPEQKVNWFEIYVKKEKSFEKSIMDLDEKMNLMIRTMGNLEKVLMSKMEYLEHRIDH